MILLLKFNFLLANSPKVETDYLGSEEVIVMCSDCTTIEKERFSVDLHQSEPSNLDVPLRSSHSTNISSEEYNEHWNISTPVANNQRLAYLETRKDKKLFRNKRKKDKIIFRKPSDDNELISEVKNNEIVEGLRNNRLQRFSLTTHGVKNDTKGILKRDNKMRKIGLIDSIFDDLSVRGSPDPQGEHQSGYKRLKKWILSHPLIDNDQRMFIKHKNKMLEVIYRFEEIFCAARNIFPEFDQIEFRFDIYDFKFVDAKDFISIDDIIDLYRKTSKLLKKKNKILNLSFFSEYAMKNILVLEEIKTILMRISRKIIDNTNQESLILPLIMCLLN